MKFFNWLRVFDSLIYQLVEGLGRYFFFLVKAFSFGQMGRFVGRRLIGATHELGVRCLPVIMIVGLFTGMVLGLQGYHVLNRFGSEGLLGSLVSLSVVRELGPVLAGLMLLGQAGSAFAAELAMQRQGEQLSALEMIGIDPVRYLVAPRILAIFWIFILQTSLFCMMGLLGGLMSASIVLRMENNVYWAGVSSALDWRDLLECLVKSVFFGWISMSVAAYQGFYCHLNLKVRGAKAVSQAATRSVVYGSVLILWLDYVITGVLMER